MKENGNISIKEINETISMLKEQTETLESITKQFIKDQYHIDLSIIDDILPITMDDIEKMDEPACREFITKYTNLSNLSKITSELIEDEECPEVTNENEAIHHILKEIKEATLRILSSKYSIKKIEDDYDKMFEEIVSSYNSEESVEKRKQNLITMQKEIDEETDPDKKLEMEHKFKVISNSFTLDFFKERLDKFGDKEVSAIVDAFFDKTKSSYILNRFKNKMAHINRINPGVYRNFFNIEEYFCGEEYYPYNNLFLFIYMRYVCHCDPYNNDDKIYVQAITTAMANLMYHKFGTDEYEKEMVDLVKNIIDRFKPYHERFESENLMNPNHPMNKDRVEKIEQENKKKVITALNKYNIVVDDIESKSSTDLRKILNDSINNIIESQVVEYNKLNEKTEDGEDISEDEIDALIDESLENTSEENTETETSVEEVSKSVEDTDSEEITQE